METDKKELLKGVSLPTFLLCLAAFMAPLIGGQVVTEPMALNGSPLSEMFFGASIPLMTRLVLSLPVLLAGFLLLRTNRVFQIPHLWILGGLGLMSVLMLAPSLSSSFPQSGVTQGLSWLVYFAMLAVVVATVGRSSGPSWVVGALCLGIGLLAAKGIQEYVEVASIHPWRIFAGWNNPNGVASMFVMGFPLLVAMAVRGQKVLAAIAVVFAGMDASALWYTGSKGGLLALAVGLVVLIGYAIYRRQAMPVLMSLGACLAMSLVIYGGVKVMTTPKGGVASSAERQLNSGADSTQSLEFRKLLWKSTTSLIGKHPLGIGAGNFRYYSAQPGLVEQTVYSHQTWLQIALEGSILALAAAIAALVVWFKSMIFLDPNEPKETAILRSGVIAAVTAVIAHGFIESNLYTFGTGLTFFLLLGIGLQLTPTGTAPEMTTTPWRVGVGAIGLAVLVGLVTSATGELARANFLGVAHSGDKASISSLAEPLKQSDDAESIYLAGTYGSSSASDYLEAMKRASTLAPKTKYLRAYANALAQTGDHVGAEEQLNRALEFDPTNLRTLLTLMKQRDSSGDTTGAMKAARSLVSVETTSVFKIRAISDVIPVETYDARVYIAEHSTDPDEIESILLPSVKGYEEFAKITYPKILAADKDEPGTAAYGGMDLKTAKEAVSRGVHAAQMLSDHASTAEAKSLVDEAKATFATIEL